MDAHLDLETLAKIYAPLVAASGALWKLVQWRLKVRDREREQQRKAEQATIRTLLEKSEAERRADRKECAEKHDALQKKLDDAHDRHVTEMSSAFNRMADSLKQLAEKVK